MKLIKKFLKPSGPITRYETLPNIEVIGYRPIQIKTYKPLHKDYPFTGHSSVDIPIDEETSVNEYGNPYGISVDKTSKSKDYNLVTNNCADATLGALNYIFGTNEKPYLFTTPGDVRDYAINKLHGKVTRDENGIDTILIPRNKYNAKRISKKALEWAKGKDEDTVYEFDYKDGGQIRKMLTAAGGPLTLPGKSQEEVDEINNYNKNKAKGLFKGMISGKVLPTMSNIGSMLGAAYSGWLDPETTSNTGEVPNPGMRNPKLIVSAVLDIDKFKNILKNYNPYVYRKPKLPEIKINDKIIDDVKNIKIDPNDLFTDNFIKYLEKQTGRKIKRIPYKNTKDGNIYKEGFSFVDENGKEIAHIAGNLKGKNVWVESSYVDPEFRHKGLGKLMYFDFNDNVYNTYGTTLHSSASQRLGYVDGGGMSPSNRLWKSLTDNKLATTEGSGFDWWNIMTDPSKIKTEYRKQGGKMNILEFLKNGSGIHIKEKNKGSFTRWCGGNVTEECIRRGKNSSNPKIRKKATFAANARKWKHKDGGILYIFLEGGKTSWWNKAINFVNNSGLGEAALNALSTYTLNKLIGAGSDVAKALVDKDKASRILQANLAAELEARNIQLNNINPENPNAMSGDIVKNFIKNKLLSLKMALINLESNLEKAEIDWQTLLLKNLNTWAGIGSALMQGLGHVGLYLGNKLLTNVNNIQ